MPVAIRRHMWYTQTGTGEGKGTPFALVGGFGARLHFARVESRALCFRCSLGHRIMARLTCLPYTSTLHSNFIIEAV
jgi:hypothetical protein